MLDRNEQTASASERAAVPRLRLVGCGHAPVLFQFNIQDLLAIDDWRIDTDRHGYPRILVERGSDPTRPESGGFALVYAPGETWAEWGLSRAGAQVEAWTCATGRLLGRFTTMRAALDALPIARRTPPSTRRHRHAVSRSAAAAMSASGPQ